MSQNPSPCIFTPLLLFDLCAAAKKHCCWSQRRALHASRPWNQRRWMKRRRERRTNRAARVRKRRRKIPSRRLKQVPEIRPFLPQRSESSEPPQVLKSRAWLMWRRLQFDSPSQNSISTEEGAPTPDVTDDSVFFFVSSSVNLLMNSSEPKGTTTNLIPPQDVCRSVFGGGGGALLKLATGSGARFSKETSSVMSYHRSE